MKEDVVNHLELSLESLREGLKRAPLGQRGLESRRGRLRGRLRLGRVYFIQHPTGLIKIGFTSNLPKRFRELQLTEHPDIALLGSIGASMHYEKRLHRVFASYHLYWEWFEPSDLLILYINTFTDAPGDSSPNCNWLKVAENPGGWRLLSEKERRERLLHRVKKRKKQ